MALPAGTRLGPYDIVSFIGACAMGVVYKARDDRRTADVGGGDDAGLYDGQIPAEPTFSRLTSAPGFESVPTWTSR